MLQVEIEYSFQGILFNQKLGHWLFGSKLVTCIFGQYQIPYKQNIQDFQVRWALVSQVMKTGNCSNHYKCLDLQTNLQLRKPAVLVPYRGEVDCQFPLHLIFFLKNYHKN